MRIGRAGLGLLLMVAVALSHGPARAEDSTPASHFVQELGQQAMTVLETTAPAERRHALALLLGRGFDVPLLARLAIGKTWKEMSEPQRQDYRAAFEVWLLETYAARLEATAGQRFVVKGAEPSAKDVIVRSEIVTPGRPSARVDWRVRSEGGEPRIVDVVVEGVSLVVTHRNEFQAMLQHGGVPGLIETLRHRAGTGSGKSGSMIGVGGGDA